MSYSDFKLKYLLFAIIFIAFVGCGDKEEPPSPPLVPEVTSISPSSLYSGDMFIIAGKNFGDNSAGKQVMVGEIPATIASDGWTDTEIRASVEIDPGVYQVKILFPDTTIIAGDLTFIPQNQPLPLQITTISPSVVEPGQTFELVGTSFGETQGTSFVQIGSVVVAEYPVWNDENISCIVPVDMAEGIFQVVVITDEEESNAVALEVKIPEDPSPIINSMAPVSGKVGDVITLSGESFGSQTSSSSVSIGSLECTDYTEWNNTSIKFVIPADAVSDTVKVTVDGKISNGRFLIVEEDVPADLPVIISTNNESYPILGSITIRGMHFGSSQGTGKVILHSNQEGTIQQWRDTQIRVTVPQGAQSGPIYVITDAGLQSNEYNIFINYTDEFTTILVNKGTFIMGDNNSTSNGEAPEHQVTISYDFYMSETPVTRAQYQTITQTFPPAAPGIPNNNVPVHNVSFADACRFCNRLSDRLGLEQCYTITGTGNSATITCDFSKNGYRLPTEAEWEYAARAGNTGDWGFSGDPNLFVWHSGNATQGNPLEVKTRDRNNWGFYDMYGNVGEMCWDYFSMTYYQECVNGVVDPRGPTEVTANRIFRGGDFQTSLEHCKATSRNSFNAGSSGDYKTGFRFVRRR